MEAMQLGSRLVVSQESTRKWKKWSLDISVCVLNVNIDMMHNVVTVMHMQQLMHSNFSWRRTFPRCSGRYTTRQNAFQTSRSAGRQATTSGRRM